MRYVSRMAVLGFCSVVPSVLFAQFTVTNYQFVSSQQVTTTLANVTYKADIVNTGNPEASVLATATSQNPSSFTMVTGQDTLSFAPVPANTPVTSSNTFTMRVNRTIPFDFANVQWTFKTTPLPPVANAGPNQTAKVGDTVTLDGTGSTNPSGVGTLTYSWAFTFRPGGAAHLNNPTSVNPSFVLDVAGNFTIALTVSNGVASSTSSVTVSTVNSPPVANAGPNQTVAIGTLVQLDGSHSSDVDGNALTFQWSFSGLPPGSLASLIGPTTVAPKFTTDKVGTYQIQLIVNDGTTNSQPAFVTVTTQNSPPVANAGPNQAVAMGALVHLNGTGSTDVDGDPLTYRWSIITPAPGSNAVLSSTTDPMPTFTVDVPGTYVIQLIVNDGHVDSLPATVTITTNALLAPTANAGANQTVGHGVTVTLSGSGTDPQGLALTYQWSLTNKPLNSLAVLSSPTLAKATLVADLPGLYTAQLVVNNSYLSSLPATVNITTTNTPPVANAGSNQSVTVGTTVQLDGSGSSDADHDPLTYSWSLTKPPGSNALITTPNIAQPTFVPDIPGTYIAQLMVNDGFANSSPVTVTITAVSSFRFSFSPNPLNLTTAADGTVRVTAPFATVASQDVQLTGFDPTIVNVPGTATIPAGGTFVDVAIGTLKAGSTSIVASCLASCGYQPGTGTVNVTAATISLALNSTNITVGGQTTGTVTLSVAAGSTGVTVALSSATSAPSSPVTLNPTNVQISAGSTTGTFTVTGGAVGSATITGSASRYSNGTVSVTVGVAGTIVLPANAAVAPGQSVPYPVSLAAAAPQGGVTITLSTSDPNIVTVTPSVFIDTGATTPTTGAQITGVNPGTATITASAQNFTGTTGNVSVTSALGILTTSLPSGTVNTPYSQTLRASGGSGAYTWQLTAGTLPAGLTLTASTGLISGTPTAATNATPLTFKVTDSSSPVQTASVSLNLTIAPPALSITTTSLANGAVGVAYSESLAATGGTQPYHWQLTFGTLPAGLSLNATTGLISGTPTQPASSTQLTFQVTDSGSPSLSANASLTLTVTPATLTISTTSLPNGSLLTAYSQTLAATGGTGAYTWTLTSGTLPAGLSLNASTGLISGTPTAIVSATPLTFKVTDSGSPVQTATVNLTLTVIPGAFTITTTSLANGVMGTAYSQTLTATGGTTPYSWQLTAGTLPNGLSLNATTGQISGTPTAIVSATPLTFKATDSGSPAQTASVSLTLTITGPGLAITTTSLPDGQVGAAYSQALAASGGTGPYTWQLTVGTLPSGLSLTAATGLISGTPNTAVSATPLSFKVTDSSSPVQTATANLTLTIAPAQLKITTTALFTGQVGVAYTQTLATSGGTGAVTWQLTSGTLPNGLTLNAASGLISGTPTVAVNATPLTFKATDSGSPAQAASATLNLTIVSPLLSITTPALSTAVINVAYSFTLQAAGGTQPYSWSVTAGRLPSGMTLDPSGLISGTPTFTSSSSLTFKVTDSSSPVQTATMAFPLTVVTSGVTINTTGILSGQLNQAYPPPSTSNPTTQTLCFDLPQFCLSATGGIPPYGWQVVSGTLPAGLTLDSSSGAITGTPTEVVTKRPLVFQVNDSGGQAVIGTFNMSIASGALAIPPTTLPNGVVGTAYSQTLVSTDGVPTTTWQLTKGTLPNGLTLDPTTGIISGTPTNPITATPLTFKVTDSGVPAASVSVDLTLTILTGPLTITTTSLPNGSIGTAYSQTLIAVGGIGAHTWQLTAGTLPNGLTLNATTGLISGTPTALVNATPLTFQATDSGSPVQTASVSLTLTITTPPLTITTTSLANGSTGVAYSQTLAATGGTGAYSWQLTSGTLPAGLSLNASSGLISGTPTAAAAATPLSFKVTDSGSPAQTATANLTLTITAPVLTITTTSLPDAVVGTPYSFTLTASGGLQPYAWSVSAGRLPGGMTLDPATGTISGTPQFTDPAQVTFKVTDSSSPVQTATAVLNLNILFNNLTISTTSLPNGQVGAAYSATLTATGGTTPYAWSITSGVLPNGLSLNASTGLISGTPVAATSGAVRLTIQVKDSSSPQVTASTSLQITVLATALTISTTSLPNGAFGVAYSQTLVATGGTSPYTWQLTSGTLPTGLSLNATTGLISGTPSLAIANTPLTFKVTDSSSPAATASVNLTLTITPATPVITTTTLPNGQVGVAYSQTLTATGGSGALTWTLTAGTLPNGLSLNASTGAISGTPTAAVAATPLTFKVTDSSSPALTATANLTLTITPATLTITNTSLANGTVNVGYLQTLLASGGTGALTWQLTSGTLPAGLALNASAGTISGTPTIPVLASPLTFKVTDSGSPVQTATSTNLSITISPAGLAVTTSSLPSGQVNVPYSQMLAASGGTGADTWQLTSGTLPAGLSLNATTGLISGTPNTPVTASLTFKVTDSGSPAQTATANLTLTIAPATLTITTVSLSTGVVNVSYSQTLAASGGTGAYTWQLTSGTLPNGLSLNATTGLISGTPTTQVTATPLTFKVTDSGSPAQTASANFTLTIAPPALTITTTSLTNGVVGTAYSQTLQAAGGITPFSWVLTSGTLPSGLTLNPSTGVISGTPGVAVSATPLTFKVTDSASPAQTASANLTLTITPQTLLITTSSLTGGQVGVAYSQTLAATGGTGAYTWQLTSGTLPSGLGLNAATGLISGTPSNQVVAAPLTFKVTDSGSPAQTASANLTLTIAPATLVITTASLAAGQVNVPYSLTLAATGGTGAYMWQLTAGTLPAGLSLNGATGLISGTPSTPVVNTPLTFKVADSGSPVQTASQAFTLTIQPATLLVTTSSLPNGQALSPYSQTLAASGGTGAYTWQLTAGTLPTGLSLNASTGTISGTPAVPATATLGFKVTDSGSPVQTANASFTLTIIPAVLTITTATTLPSGTALAAYSQTLAAVGGTGAYTWQLTAGTLPSGLSLNAATGLISGTPAAPVNATPLTFKVTDSGSPVQTASQAFTLTIAPATLTITTASPLPNGTALAAYSQTLAAVGGTGAYTWQLTAGTLPTGLSLNAATGLISGTPTLPVVPAVSLTFKVTDSGSPAQTASSTLSLTILPATLTVTTASLPNGTQGVAYSQTLAAIGGTGAYTWQLTSGTLPNGISLNASTGLLSGTPTAAVNATPLTFKVTDSGSPAQTATANLTLTIAPPILTITTTSLTNGSVNVPYSQTLAATGGTGSYSWQLTSGTLPNGLSLNAATGQISGTPTVQANVALTFKVTDSGSPAQTASAILNLTIIPSTLVITTNVLPNGVAGVGYTAGLAATGGTLPYTWSAGGLPAGLAVTGNQILGTPSALGTASVTLTVTDSTLPTPMTAQVTLPLIVVRLLIIGTSSLPDATAGTAYTFTMNASGGTVPYSWSSPNLPPGLSISSLGVISGTPTGSSTLVTINVTDSGSPVAQTASTQLQLNVVGGVSGTFTISSISVGKNLQALVTVTSSQAAPTSGLPFTLSSGDASKVVMNGQSGPTSQITTSIPGGQTSVSLNVQALSDTGSVTLTAAAIGFTFGSQGGVITLTPSGFVLSAGATPGGSFNANQGSSTSLTVASARLDASNNFVEFQAVRIGFSTAVPISNTSSSVGTVSPASVTFSGGDSSYTVAFNATNTGSTTQSSATLTATVPTGFALPAGSANSVIAFIAGAGIIPCNTTVGNHLEAACNVTLNGTAPGPGVLNVTLTSGDPTKLLLSNTPDGAGQSQITVTVASNHSISSTFYVFGLASSGTPTYSASASGFGSATGSITLAPSGFIISGPNLGLDFSTQTGPQGQVGVTVYSSLLTPTGDFSTTQSIAGGQSVTVNVTNTDIPPASGVGSLTPSQLTIPGGSGFGVSTFQGLTSGSTRLAVVQPTGYTTPNQFTSVKATVSQPGIGVISGGAVGFHLQDMAAITLGAIPTSSVVVTVTSSTPSQLLVATDPTVAGADHVTITFPAGTRSANFYFYGVASSGTPTFTVSAPGFGTFTGTESVTPSAVLIASGPQLLSQVTTNVSSGNLSLTVYLAQLDPNTLNIAQFEPLAGGFSIQVPVSNSNSVAGTLASSSLTFNGNDMSKDDVFTPKAPGGITTIGLTAPTNFTVSTQLPSVQITVNNQ